MVDKCFVGNETMQGKEKPGRSRVWGLMRACGLCRGCFVLPDPLFDAPGEPFQQTGGQEAGAGAYCGHGGSIGEVFGGDVDEDGDEGTDDGARQVLCIVHMRFGIIPHLQWYLKVVGGFLRG